MVFIGHLAGRGKERAISCERIAENEGGIALVW